ncbi:MAG: hypothetical protein ACR2RB_13300 [Gammaproteobacteria bacterium]
MSRATIVEMREITNAEELAKAREQRMQFDRNSEWLQNNISDIYARHRGRVICVAGQEVFVADTAKQAIVKAVAAHPDDEGWFTRYIPKEKVARIYAV